jgi:MFS superfamily sulfate permease-like transporter
LSAGLAICTGLVLLVLGIFKLGFVSQFLSTAVQVGFMIGLGLAGLAAQGFAARHRYDVDANRELIAIGGSNVLSGLVRGFIVGGGASQSAANDSAGGADAARWPDPRWAGGAGGIHADWLVRQPAAGDPGCHRY